MSAKDMAAVHRPNGYETDWEVAARGMCAGSAQVCACEAGQPCFALERYGDLAVRALSALHRRKRLISPFRGAPK